MLIFFYLSLLKLGKKNLGTKPKAT